MDDSTRVGRPSRLAKAQRLMQTLGPAGFVKHAGRKLTRKMAWEAESVLLKGITDKTFRRQVDHVDRLKLRLDRFMISPWLDTRVITALPEDERAAIVARAARILAHEFDLLGAGPCNLGPSIDWSADWVTGHQWPAKHWHRINVHVGNGTDIKRPWELSRFQHVPLLAQASWLTGDPAYAREFGGQIDSWLAANPLGKGPNWVFAREAAIRSANWIYGAWAFRRSALPAVFWDRLFRALYDHGTFIQAHLEDREVRGNHYVADLTGLLYLGALFGDVPAGKGWWDFAYRHLMIELDHQVGADGMAHEASVPYHRLVTEMFVSAEQLAARCGEPFPEPFRYKVAAMRDVVHHYLGHDGFAPSIGDGDDGRWHKLSNYGSGRSDDHRHLFTDFGLVPPAEPVGSTAYRDGGLYLLRSDLLRATIHCGGTGLDGHGGHGHCDQLAVTLDLGPYPLILDPGTGVYLADVATRHRFRSTAYHATVTVDAAEQNPIAIDEPFAMADVTRAACLEWHDDDGATLFIGRHHGYERLTDPVTHTREVRMDKAHDQVSILDRLDATDVHEYAWYFPVPDMPCAIDEDGRFCTQAEGRPNLVIAPTIQPGLSWEMLDGEVSSAYGRIVPAKRLCFRLRAKGTVVQSFVIRTK